MMDKSVKLDFKYTKTEFVKASRQYYLKRSIRNVIVSLAFIVLVLYVYRNQNDPLTFVFLTLAGVLLFLTGIANFVIPRVRFKNEPKYQSEYHLNFNEENLKFKTGDIDSKINWDYYKEAYENKDFYFLVYMKEAYSIIPKRAFTTQDDIEKFRSLVESKLGKIKQK